MRQPLTRIFQFLLYTLWLAGCTNMVGNGSAYVGGGDGSTQAQVETALKDALAQLAATISTLASGKIPETLYAAPDCATTTPLCLASSVESDAHRQFARDQILFVLPGMGRELASVKVTLTETLPEIIDAFGHSRAAAAATSAQPGAEILIASPKFRALTPIELRPALVEAISHELMHHLTQKDDRSPLGAFSSADGGQECFTFVGKIFRFAAYPESFGSAANDHPNDGTIFQSDASFSVPLVGIPGGSIASAPEVLVSNGGIHVFVVGAQDSIIYRSFFNGSVWNGFSPLFAGATSTTAVSAVEYSFQGESGIMVAGVKNGLVSLYFSQGGRPFVSAGQVTNQNLSTGGMPNLFTSLAPKLINFTAIGYLELYVTGTDGKRYVSVAPFPSSTFAMANYYNFSGGVTYATGSAIAAKGNGFSLFLAQSDGAVQKIVNAYPNWLPAVSIGISTSLTPSAAILGNVEWLAYVATNGKLALYGYDFVGQVEVTAPRIGTRFTPQSPALISYNGHLRVYSVSGDGKLFETSLP